jgi:hypothetical protein
VGPGIEVEAGEVGAACDAEGTPGEVSIDAVKVDCRGAEGVGGGLGRKPGEAVVSTGSTGEELVEVRTSLTAHGEAETVRCPGTGKQRPFGSHHGENLL